MGIKNIYKTHKKLVNVVLVGLMTLVLFIIKWDLNTPPKEDSFSPKKETKTEIINVNKYTINKENSTKLINTLNYRVEKINDNISKHKNKENARDFLTKFNVLHDKQIKALSSLNMILANDIFKDIRNLIFNYSNNLNLNQSNLDTTKSNSDSYVMMPVRGNLESSYLLGDFTNNTTNFLVNNSQDKTQDSFPIYYSIIIQTSN